MNQYNSDGEFISSSPPPVQQEKQLLSFPDAMREILNLKRITRESWNDEQEYGVLQDGFLCIHTKGKNYTWTVNDGDLNAIDWIALED